MNLIPVELKKTKFIAYYFDGTEKSAKEFCRKWSCNYKEDILDKNQFNILLPNGTALYPNNYVVIDGNDFTKYVPEKFDETFNQIYDGRQKSYSFMVED